MPILGTHFYQMSSAIFHHSLTPIQLAVFSYLVSCDDSREKCWPSMNTIAACCGRSKNAARSAVDVLAARGFIHKVASYSRNRYGRSRQSNNTYFTLSLPPLEQLPPH